MPKEEIYTIPLWDAVKSDDECPFCFLEKKLETDLLDFCLSDAYMQQDFRATTNEIGFCRIHFTQLFSAKNRLGLTLVNQTHIMKMMKVFEENTKSITTNKPGLFKKTRDKTSSLDSLYFLLTNDCYICNRIEETMSRYMETFFYLYKKDETFVEYLTSTKGFCMPHYIKLIQTCQNLGNKTLFDSFMNQSLPLFKENMDRILEDMQWFVNKYDYRYENEPWKNAKDAPKRSIQKINGHILD